MGTRKTTSRAESRARALRARGKTVREIAAQLRAEGLRGSKSTIGAWLAAKEPKRTASSPRARTAPPATSMLQLLERSVRATERLAKVAEKEGRLSEFSALQRTLNQTIALVARHTPPEPPDPSENPDMTALGAKVAERLHRLIDEATPARGAQA